MFDGRKAMVYFHVTVVLFVLFRTSSCSEGEPRCYSRFDYEEKLMEKTVKNDIQMKEVMDKLERTLTTVEAKKLEFDETNKELKAFVKDFKAQTTAEILKEIESTIGTMGKRRQPAVLFNVRDMKNKRPAEGTTLLFNIIQQNIGDYYDQDTGIFTAPVNGTYLFSAQICTSDDKWGRVKIVVNGERVQSITNYNNAASYTTTSGTTVQLLEEGGQVWVIQDYQTGDYKDGSRYGWNQFSGVLIHT